MKAHTALLHYLKRFFFQFKRYGTDVEKNARDPYGDGDQRYLQGFEGTMVSCLSSALHAYNKSFMGLCMCRDLVYYGFWRVTCLHSTTNKYGLGVK
jgi:hypothetical protein